VFGKGFERFGQMLPFMPGFLKELKAFKNDQQKPSKGHNPAGKLMVAALLLTMCFQMVTGLVIAGTDIYYPPFGQHFASEIAIDKSQIDLIKPYSKENVDPEAYQEMRALRSPFITIHVYAFYLMLFLIPLHILGVVLAERKHKASLVSSMITGYKSLPKD
jgi:cytochrome b